MYKSLWLIYSHILTGHPMKRWCFTLLLYALSLILLTVGAAAAQPSPKKMKILVHITHGPTDATRAALAFLVAKTALDEGHTVSVFLAGDAVTLLRDAELNTVAGLGTGKLREHYDAIVKAGGKFYLSGMSSKARNITDA
ncbi:MAG: putative DsrE/DsrF-like family protein, partial [Spirosoma sp.]|nr:putative DsrE/DsrF-like family protein [Spirosoma sp.]